MPTPHNRGGRPIAQGKVAEQIAIQRLRREGYSKIHRKGHAWGSDFMAYKGGRWFRIEVKSGTSRNWKPRQISLQKKNDAIGYRIVRVDVRKPATQKRITRLTRSYAAKRRNKA